MKNPSLFFAFLLFTCWTSPLLSQNIKELFIDCPVKILGEDSSPEERRLFLDSTKVKQESVFLKEGTKAILQVLDLSAGFLSIEQGDYQLEMCYWRKRDGSKIVAICHTIIGPYLESKLRFFSYHSGTWTALRTDSILPPFSYVDMLDKRASIAANDGNPIPLNAYACATTFVLPREGKDLTVGLEWVMPSTEEAETYQFILQDRYKKSAVKYLHLLWNDGVFLKE